MKYIIAIVMFLGFSFSNSAVAEEVDILGYGKIFWEDSFEKCRDKCSPYFKEGKEGELYYCNRIREFQGVNFAKGFGITQRTGMFRPEINNTILRFQGTLLNEIDIEFLGKQDKSPLKALANLQDTYKDFKSILIAEFGKPKRTVKKGDKNQITLYQNLDIWSYPGGCIMLHIVSDHYEGHMLLKRKEKCGTM